MKRKRIGILRFGKGTWDTYEDAITRSIGSTQIRTTLQALEGGNYLDAVDVICEHPEFDEINSYSSIPRYQCDLDIGDSGVRITGIRRA